MLISAELISKLICKLFSFSADPPKPQEDTFLERSHIFFRDQFLDCVIVICSMYEGKWEKEGHPRGLSYDYFSFLITNPGDHPMGRILYC